ncbi:MAG: hypothetical protein IJ125_04185 [Atopobiaceae bacterium]|nr:hypothetical protein [Atopobiaceae bacterium]
MAENKYSEISGAGKTPNSKSRTLKDPARKVKLLETITAVLLGVTTLLTAWATWIGSLHEGLEHIHFTESNNTISSAIALYNDATQLVVQDATIYASIQNYILDAQAATTEGDDLKLQAANAKLEALEQVCSPELKAAIDWARKTGKSPFEMEGYGQSYYDEASVLVKDSQDLLTTGKQDNTNSDKYGLVTVIYSLVLFLLGIAGTFKRSPNRMLIMGTAVVLLVVGFVFMLSIPMPEGFNLLNYLGTN